MSDLECCENIKEIDIAHSSVKLTSDFTGEQLLTAILSKLTSSAWSSWEVS